MRKVHVFRTSVAKRTEVSKLRPYLDQVIRNNGRWNFDLEDCDNILRVETRVIASATIASVLRGKGFLCEEL